MDLDERLIEEVRKRPRIYDMAHIDYKNLRKKDIAWKEVASNIKLDKAQCKKRWKGLRDSYKRCKRMEQMSSGSGAGTPKHKWKYSDTMSFLDNVTSAKRTIASVTESPEIILPDDCNTNSDDLSFSDSKQTSISQTPTSSSRMRKVNSIVNDFNSTISILTMDDVEYLVNFVSTIAKITNITHLACEAYERSFNRSNGGWWVRPVNVTDEEQDFWICTKQLQAKDEEHFFKATRMNVDNFNLLLSLLNEKLQRFSNRKPIDPETRLAVTLIYLAQGCNIQVLTWAYKLGISTVRKIIYETCDAIWDELHDIYLSPPNSHELKTISNKFYVKTGVPNCLGAIDGKHVRITPYNYKRSFSSVLLAACDSNFVFTYVDVKALDSQSDGDVLARSVFGNKLLNGTLEIPRDANLPGTSNTFPHYFVGDSALPLKTNLMRPYPGHNLSEDKNKFNTMLSKARVYIENCFGILANRWRVLHTNIQACPQNADKIILATIALHNFLMLQHDRNYFTLDLVDHTENSQDIQGQWRNEIQPLESYQPRSANRSSSNAFQLRSTLKDFFTK